MLEIVDLLDELGIDHRNPGEHHHATTGRVQVDCPWCSPGSSSFRLGIQTRYLTANCWTCGKHSLYETLIEIAGRSEASRIAGFLAACRTGSSTLHDDRNAIPNVLRIPTGVVEVSSSVQHSEYLKSRRYNPDKISKLWGVKAIRQHHRCPWSLFLPVRHKKKVVSWTTRFIGEGETRYINARPDEESLPIKSILYGMEHVRGHTITIVEGPTDVWRVGPGSVATFGTSVTEAQKMAISRFPVRIVCFDSETDAQRIARQLTDELSVFPGRTIRVELDAPDPGEAKPREIKALREMMRGI